MEVHYHFILEKVLKGEIDLQYLDIEDEVTDSFTEGVSSKKIIDLYD